MFASAPPGHRPTGSMWWCDPASPVAAPKFVDSLIKFDTHKTIDWVKLGAGVADLPKEFNNDGEWKPSMFWRLFILIVCAFIGAGTNLFIAASHKIDVAHEKMFEIIYSLHHRLNQRGQPDPRPGLTFLFLSFRLNYIHYTYTCYNK